LQCLEFVEALSKSLSLLHVSERLVECVLRSAERAGGDIDTSAVEPGHRNLEADTLLAKAIFNRHVRVLEDHGAGRLRVPAHLAFIGAER
jgi:hypothetical protein